MDKDKLIKELVEALEDTLGSIKVGMYDGNNFSLLRDYRKELEILQVGKQEIEKMKG